MEWTILNHETERSGPERSGADRNGADRNLDQDTNPRNRPDRKGVVRGVVFIGKFSGCIQSVDWTGGLD